MGGKTEGNRERERVYYRESIERENIAFIAMLNTVKWVTLTLTFSSQLADNSIICFSHLPLSLPNDLY